VSAGASAEVPNPTTTVIINKPTTNIVAFLIAFHPQIMEIEWSDVTKSHRTALLYHLALWI
jgi:hypothetical protein